MKCLSSFVIALCLAVLLGSFFSNECAAEPELELPEIYHRTSDNHFFEVASLDFNSLQTVTQMAKEMGELGAGYFTLSNALRPILVQLKPEREVSFKTAYVIRPQVNGEVTVDIKWSEETVFEEVCQALASGFLNRAAIFHFGGEAAAKVPDWMELAFAQLLIGKLRPSYIDHQREFAMQKPMLTAEQIMRASAPFSEGQERVGINAFYFLHFLKSELKADAFERAMLGFLSGYDPLSVVKDHFPEFNSRKDMELWWAVGFQQIVRSRQGAFYSLRESREWIERLTSITLESESGEERLVGVKLWERRDVAGMDAEILHRLREIKLQIQKINHVYFNALLSLGLSFESLQNGSEQDFYAQYEQFLTDYEEAVLLDSSIQQLLDY